MFKDYELRVPASFTEEQIKLAEELWAEREKRMRRFTRSQYMDILRDLYRRLRPDLAKELAAGIPDWFGVDKLDALVVNVTALCLSKGLLHRPEYEPAPGQSELPL